MVKGAELPSGEYMNSSVRGTTAEAVDRLSPF
jgi:hypothetical protein